MLRPAALEGPLACRVGGSSADPWPPQCLGTGMAARGSPQPWAAATYSGDDSGVRLDISSGVGTVHVERTKDMTTVPLSPPPQRCARHPTCPRAPAPDRAQGHGAAPASGAIIRPGLLWPPAVPAVPRQMALVPCAHPLAVPQARMAWQCPRSLGSWHSATGCPCNPVPQACGRPSAHPPGLWPLAVLPGLQEPGLK